MATKGYNSYSGRRNGKKIALVVVLLLILLGAVAYLLAQQYVVYEDDGSIRLELPFFTKKDTPAPLPSSDEVNIQRDDEDPDAKLTPTKPSSALEELHATELPYGVLTWDPSELLVDESAVVVNIKRFDGAIAYQSSLTTLPDSVLQGNPDTLTHLKTIMDSDCYTVARISALCDNAFALGRPESAMRYPDGQLWYDNYSRTWLDPSQSSTVEYLCALAKECEKLGFDEILLEHFRYPIEGDLSLTSLSENTDRGAAIAKLAGEIHKAAPSLRVSVMLPASIGTDYSFSASGLPAKVLAENFDRIYVPRESAAYYWLDGALPADYDRASRLVLTDYTVPSQSGSYMVCQ